MKMIFYCSDLIFWIVDFGSHILDCNILLQGDHKLMHEKERKILIVILQLIFEQGHYFNQTSIVFLSHSVRPESLSLRLYLSQVFLPIELKRKKYVSQSKIKKELEYI